MKITGKTLGRWGEEQALKYLERNGVKILGKNILSMEKLTSWELKMRFFCLSK